MPARITTAFVVYPNICARNRRFRGSVRRPGAPSKSPRSACPTRDRASRSAETDLAQERPQSLRELVWVLVICIVSTRRGGDVDAEALAQAPGDLGVERMAVLADEQAHRRGKGGQRLLVGQARLVGSRARPPSRAGGGAHALTKRGRQPRFQASSSPARKHDKRSGAGTRPHRHDDREGGGAPGCTDSPSRGRGGSLMDRRIATACQTLVRSRAFVPRRSEGRGRHSRATRLKSRSRGDQRPGDGDGVGEDQDAGYPGHRALTRESR